MFEFYVIWILSRAWSFGHGVLTIMGKVKIPCSIDDKPHARFHVTHIIWYKLFEQITKYYDLIYIVLRLTSSQFVVIIMLLSLN